MALAFEERNNDIGRRFLERENSLFIFFSVFSFLFFSSGAVRNPFSQAGY
jgi:hypothetical protein